MSTIHSCNILPGVALTCVNSDKFKTGCMSVNIVTALKREKASLSALFPRVLRRGTKDLPDMERLAAALDDMYGAYVEPIVRKKGELHCVGLYSDFPDDRYIPGEGDVMERVISLTGEMLLSPDTNDGYLRDDYIAGEKKNLIDDIRAAINDKRGYAIDRLLEQMCADEIYGVNRLGSETEAEAITPETLTAHYRGTTEASAIKIFYCGSAEPSRVEAALRASLAGLPGRGGAKIPATDVVIEPRHSTPRLLTETLDVAQGKLTIGFRLGKAMQNPNYPALSVFNAIYGGSVSSKLFLNVREKLSLCYYASSMMDKHKGIMVVSSGVDFSKFDMARDEILAQLENIKKGEISDWEFQSAKRAVITAVKSAMDRPSGLEELYFDSSIAAVYIDPDELCGKIEAITPDDVVETASEIKVDSIYTMHGE